MSIITAIKSQKNQKRVNIYLDGKFGFGLDIENFVKLGLIAGRELSDEEVGKIVKKAEFQKYLDKLLRFATLRPRSVKEIYDYFRRKKVHDSLHEQLIEKLKHFELIDDEKFAVWWIGQRLQFKSPSKRVLKQELRNKGVQDDLIDKALTNADIDEVKEAEKIVNKKNYLWRGLPDIEKKRKMSEYLMRKGFGWEVIKKVTKSSDIDDF